MHSLPRAMDRPGRRLAWEGSFRVFPTAHRALGLWPPVMTMRSLVMSTLRKVLRGLFGPLTRRGRSFLAAGGAAVLCGLAIPEPVLVRVGALLVVLPIVSALIARRSRYRLACTRRLDPPRVAVGQRPR